MLEIGKQIAETLLGILQLMAIAGTVVAAFGLAEYWRGAGRGGGLRHRGYNLMVFGLNFMGLAVVGLVLVVPLLGHASWHAYRDLVSAQD